MAADRLAFARTSPTDQPVDESGVSGTTGECAHRHEPQRLGLTLAPPGADGARPFVLSADGEPPVTLYPVEGNTQATWRPATPLPPRDPRVRHVVIVYAPHPDDETLSMGALVADAVAQHDQVVVVALTDGRTTRADEPAGVPLSPDQVAAARDLELVRAAASLGVPARDVVLAHQDAPGSDCGAILTVQEAQAVMTTMAAHFPGALNVTMSYAAERNQDHLDAGVALQRLHDAGTIGRAAWTVSRLWWTLPSPAWSWVLPVSAASRSSVLAAARDYDVWEPGYGRYAVGWHSVPRQFEALLLDVRDKVHGTGPSSTDLARLLPPAWSVPTPEHVRAHAP